MKKSISFAVALAAAGLGLGAQAAPNGDWFQHPAISPDGKTVLFSYKGDIYRVSSKGGQATPLTVHQGWDGHPVWSRDGKQIAFGSDRNGNLDVYVMPSTGGKAKRLTYHSSNDTPSDFSPDGSAVLFNAARIDSAASINYPNGALNELYQVSVSGGTPVMIDTNALAEARYSKDGSKIAYRKEKSLESDLRKHDTSAFARDIWVKDLESGAHTKVTDFAGGDHTPVWDGDDAIYYLSEESNGFFNVHKRDLDDAEAKPLTDFDTHPVRGLSASKNGTLAYAWHGSIYTQKGRRREKLDIDVNLDSNVNDTETVPVNGRISEFAVSPNGKEIAFIARGEVFVTSKDFSTTKRITNTPEQESSVSFHKDGKTILYTSSRGDSWKLYEASVAAEDEKYFFAATDIAEKLLYGAETESFQPVYSPDGKKVAFLSQRDEIQVLDRESGDVNTALDKKYNASYADGDISFAWSSDSNWLTASFAPRGRLIMTNIGVFPADGSAEPVDITKSGYMNGGPEFVGDGDAIIWSTSQYGLRAHGSWGRQFDVKAMFLTQDAYDEFHLSKEELELKKELEKDKKAKKAKEEAEKEADDKSDEKPADKPKDADKKADKKADEPEEKAIEIDWANMEDRTIRLTQHSSDLGSYVITKDMTKMIYAARFEGGYDLWEQNFREGSVKLVSKLGARSLSLALSGDGKTLFMLVDGSLRSSGIGQIQPKPIAARAMMELKASEERAHMFEHAWRKIKDKFYNPNFHGIDWDMMKVEYAAKLPAISNNRDLARLMEELMGELNASHTGTYYIHQQSNADRTAALGLFLDYADTSGGLKIDEVISKGPFDSADSKVKAGMTLTAIDGTPLGGTVNLASLLNHKAGERVRVTVTDDEGNSIEEVIKPISTFEERGLLYDRWVQSRAALVEEISEGRLGYVHIQSMNDTSFRRIYSKVMGEYFDREAMIVDTRWNNGGWLHQDLAKLFAGKNYLNFRVRGRDYTGEPTDQWFKPSLIVINEGNYSDAHTFPYAYKALDLGKAVGMPVPGTSTSVWWEFMMSGDLYFGVPQLGNVDMNGEYLENAQVEPDVLIDNDPNDVANGDDKQLKKAVDVMLESLGK